MKYALEREGGGGGEVGWGGGDAIMVDYGMFFFL